MALESIKSLVMTQEKLSHATRPTCEGAGCATTLRQQYDAYVARLRGDLPRNARSDDARPASDVPPLAPIAGGTSARTTDTAAVAISVEGATKRYRLGKDNHVNALRGTSITIEQGEMVAIVGPSGSGKSTMMHLIGCLDTPDTGEVRINGRRVNELRSGALTRLRGTEIGFIFQGFNLIPTMNALDNVALAAEYAGVTRTEARERSRNLLELVGLGDRGGHLPSELSGGQQQRVAIARALVNRPSIVLGDEPTGDLDSSTSDEIVDLMRRINVETGTTFVIVTHNPEVADSCDRTIRMRDGLVEDHGFERCCTTPAYVKSRRLVPALGLAGA